MIEANGTISAFAKPEKRTPYTSEMNITPECEGLPMILVMDGRVQSHNLAQTGKSEKWLRRQLNVEKTYLASLDVCGQMLIQTKDGHVETVQTMPPEEVIW